MLISVFKLNLLKFSFVLSSVSSSCIMTFVSSMSPYGLIIHEGITIVKISQT
ncbi:unnamed protein product [Acanthoscelides obtectus]|uniref:Lipoprotein n=1 Tax=Acanthoscelides obtectus TaxID=200917 RepID=A0A9P0Q9N1_ACAOB|nr:unnamed protein product [Acanthoscelides obtectus]CAK1659519.1 hypothetical protein AOBTE_LOCUS21498 [Acanthoscelides obtectus]